MISSFRGGRKTEAIKNRLDYFNRAHVYMDSSERGGRKTKATDNRLDYFNRAHLYMTSAPEEAGGLKLLPIDWIISREHIFL